MIRLVWAKAEIGLKKTFVIFIICACSLCIWCLIRFTCFKFQKWDKAWKWLSVTLLLGFSRCKPFHLILICHTVCTFHYLIYRFLHWFILMCMNIIWPLALFFILVSCKHNLKKNVHICLKDQIYQYHIWAYCMDLDLCLDGPLYSWILT
jgi:hypothetical protein